MIWPQMSRGMVYIAGKEDNVQMIIIWRRVCVSKDKGRDSKTSNNNSKNTEKQRSVIIVIKNILKTKVFERRAYECVLNKFKQRWKKRKQSGEWGKKIGLPVIRSVNSKECFMQKNICIVLEMEENSHMLYMRLHRAAITALVELNLNYSILW